MTPFDVRIIANLSPPDWWTIGLTAAATVIGAVIGASIAYLVARQTARENRDAANVARRQTEEAATFRAEIKLMQLMNAVAGYHIRTERGIEEAGIELGQGNIDTWRVMRSFSGRPTEINIDADDLVAFTHAREFDYVTRTLFLFSMYNTMIYVVEAYGRRRDELMAMITPGSMQGLVGTIELNEDEMRTLMPYIATVAEMADRVREQIREVHSMALKAVDEFGPIVRKYFNDAAFPIPSRSRSSA